MPDLFDALRYVNVALAGFVVIAALHPRAVQWWRSLPAELRFLLLGLLVTAIAGGWGTVEILAQRLPGGTRVPVTTLALAWTAAGVTILHLRLRKDTP